MLQNINILSASEHPMDLLSLQEAPGYQPKLLTSNRERKRSLSVIGWGPALEKKKKTGKKKENTFKKSSLQLRIFREQSKPLQLETEIDMILNFSGSDPK